VQANPAFVRRSEVERLVASNTRLRTIRGFATSIPLEETLRWMYSAPL
jgi:hypothetical protein